MRKFVCYVCDETDPCVLSMECTCAEPSRCPLDDNKDDDCEWEEIKTKSDN